MGFTFIAFGAATVPLSKIVVDKDLDLRPYGITASFSHAPYTQIAWPTEVVDAWTESLEYTESGITPPVWPGGGQTTVRQIMEAASYGRKVIITIGGGSAYASSVTLLVGDTPVSVRGPLLKSDETHQFPEVVVAAGKTVSISVYVQYQYDFTPYQPIQIKEREYETGPKTFDLSGKWLALGLDMKGLAATVKIQGVEIPYSDYPKYFPIAPTEITIPGDWDVSQERPEIKVYK